MSLKQFKNELLQIARDEGIVSALGYGVGEVLRDHPKLAGIVLGAYCSLTGYKETVVDPMSDNGSYVATVGSLGESYKGAISDISDIVDARQGEDSLPPDFCFSGLDLDDKPRFNFSLEEPRNAINLNLPHRVPRKLMEIFSTDKGVISYMSYQLGWTEDKTREELSQYGALDDKGNIDFWKLGDWFRKAEILVDPNAPIVNNAGVNMTFPLRKGKINLNYDPSERKATVGMEYKF